MFVLGSRAKAVTFKTELAALVAATMARELFGKSCRVVNLGGAIKVKCGDAFVCRD